VKRYLLLLLGWGAASAQGVYNYFPPPGVTYSNGSGMALGAPTGGLQGVGTLNAQGVYVNGVAIVGIPALPANTLYGNIGAGNAAITYLPLNFSWGNSSSPGGNTINLFGDLTSNVGFCWNALTVKEWCLYRTTTNFLSLFSYLNGSVQNTAIQVFPNTGPYGDGGASLNQLAPYRITTQRAGTTGSQLGPYVNLTDTQPTEVAGSTNGATVQNSGAGTQLTLNWTGCCSASGPLDNTNTVDTYVTINSGSNTVGGSVINSIYRVVGRSGVNVAIIDCGAVNGMGAPLANCTSIGSQPTAVQVSVTPSANYTLSERDYYPTSSAMNALNGGGVGFLIGETVRCVWNPLVFIPLNSSGSPQFQCLYEQDASPNDTSGANVWGWNNEHDMIYRGAKPGYGFLTRSYQNFMNWRDVICWGLSPAFSSAVIPGGGTATDCPFGLEFLHTAGLAIVNPIHMDPDVLQGVPNSPDGHGGVFLDGTLSWEEPASLVTTVSSSVITINMAMNSGQNLYDVVNGDTVVWGQTQTCDGVTLTANQTYSVAGVSQTGNGSFTITGSGTGATGTTCTLGTTSYWFSFSRHVPYSWATIRGEGKHLIVVDPQTVSDDDLVINIASGSGPTADGGYAFKIYTVATLPVTCNTAHKDWEYAVSDATSPTWNATLTGGGAVNALALCNGSAWTAH